MDKLPSSDPKVFGPGMWYVIHNTALKMGEETFSDWIYITLSSIPCLKCRTHAMEYLKQNPLDLFKDVYDEEDGELVGMFKWSWNFHNTVNQKLKKSTLDYRTAYRMYRNESICSSDCGN